MKTYFLVVLVLFITVMEGIAASSIHRISHWPYSSLLPYLQPSPNSVATGEHSDYPEGIVIWAVGDIISVLNADGLSEITSFRVNTKTAVNDFYYRDKDENDDGVEDDDGVEILYLASGVNGLQIYDFSTLPLPPTPPTLMSTYATSPANPGYLDSEEIDEIDATGVGYYDNHIFLTDNNFGLRVINVENMAAPEETLLDPEIEIPLGYVEYNDDADTGEDPYEEAILTRTSGYIQPNISDSYDVTGGYTNIEVISYSMPGPIGDKTYACVLDYYYGLRVFDVTDPTKIREEDIVSKFMVTENWFYYHALITDIYVAVGSDDRLYAYVTGIDEIGSSRVARLDVLSDDGVLEYDNNGFPSITNIGRSITPGVSSGVFVKDDYAYVADGTRGLQIVDISTGLPIHDDTPVLNYQISGSYDTSETVDMGSLSLAGGDGDTIYLHDTLVGLLEINVTDKAAPLYVREIPSQISGDSVYTEGEFAYCLDSGKGVRIFDISEPTAITLEGFYETTGNDISVLGDYAYITKGVDGLEIVDITTKTEPAPPMPTPPVPEPPPVLMDTDGNAVAVAVYQSGGSTYACVADSGLGLAIIDVSIPATPGAPSVVAGTGTVNDVSISGGYAYIAENFGLRIIDLATVSVSASKATGENAIAVSVYTDVDSNIYAVISDSDGITIENVTDLTSIDEVATIDTIEDGHNFVSLEVLDNYLFASAGEKGIYVYDLSVLPATPNKIEDFDGIYPSKEVSPFKKDDSFYFASAEESNVIAVYELNFGSPPTELLSDGDDGYLSCFISSLKN